MSLDKHLQLARDDIHRKALILAHDLLGEGADVATVATIEDALAFAFGKGEQVVAQWIAEQLDQPPRLGGSG